MAEQGQVLGAIAWGLYLFAVPTGFALLALLSRARDPVSAQLSGITALLFLGQWLALGPLALWPAMPAVLVVLFWLDAAVTLAARIAFDRRQRHSRSTLESLAVLTIGASLIAVLFAGPL